MLMQKKNAQKNFFFELRDFRSITKKLFEFDAQCTVLVGSNGVGKTSILEACYYLAHMRSFRTYWQKEMIRHGQSAFFIKGIFGDDHDQQETVHVGVSSDKKIMKWNNKPITNLAPIRRYYDADAISEHDMQLITGAPLVRRSFIDNLLLRLYPDKSSYFDRYREILSTRNRFLFHKQVDENLYAVYTQQLWEYGSYIRELRIDCLAFLYEQMVTLASLLKTDSIVTAKYQTRFFVDHYKTFEQFLAKHHDFTAQEYRYGRSLFGVHLDDIIIHYNQYLASNFASRGQQKMLALLIKVASIMLIQQRGAHKDALFLILVDDFVTDFDLETRNSLLDILCSLGNKLIFTCPSGSNGFLEEMRKFNANCIVLE